MYRQKWLYCVVLYMVLRSKNRFFYQTPTSRAASRGPATISQPYIKYILVRFNLIRICNNSASKGLMLSEQTSTNITTALVKGALMTG